MKLRLETTLGELITFADADDGLPPAPVLWAGRMFYPGQCVRMANGVVFAVYRETEKRPPDPILVNDPNTPRRQP